MPFTEYAEILRNHKAHENDINLGKFPLKNTTLADTPSLKSVGETLGLTKPISDMKSMLRREVIGQVYIMTQ